MQLARESTSATIPL